MQATLKNSTSCIGTGVHSGNPVHMTLRPAPANSGIQFVRTDITGVDNVVPASWDKVVETTLCTVIANDAGVKVSTIEHLMAALLGCGVDNVIVEINNEEIPIMDGSAKDFVALIDNVGLEPQNAPRRVLRIKKEVVFEEGDKRAVLKPASTPTYSFEIDFSAKNMLIGKQNQHVQLVNGNFRHEICDARTFGLLEEVEYLKSIGLARGGSLENAIVVSKDKILNPEGLRFDNEFVRHKILDSIGDLYLAGGPLKGHFDGVRAGHAVNNKILHVLFAQADAWEWTTEE